MTPGFLLLVAALALLAGGVGAGRWARVSVLATVVAGVAGAGAALWVLGGGGAWEWMPGLEVGGEAVHLRLDAISALFLLLVALLGALGAVYGREYWPDIRHPVSGPRMRLLWNVMVGAMGGVLLCSNGLHFLLVWEVFTVSAYFLITQERQKREVRAAGWLYLAASHAGTLCLIAFFASLAARTGSWELGPMLDRPEVGSLFWLALCGFGLKAGVFPLHVWLPSAHANAPSHVSALLSGVAIKMGIYGLVRFSGWLPVPVSAAWVLVLLGVASAVLGVAFALGQHDLKRLLAYHSVENIGIILIGLGFGLAGAAGVPTGWGRLAFAGGMLHVFNHGVFKALLFFGAGAAVHATGTREMGRLGGLWGRMPWTAGCFLLGAAAISGLPPLNGFVSEWLVYLGLFDAVLARGNAALAAVPSAVLLGVTGALALACFVKVFGVVFLGVPRSAMAETAHECGWWMRLPMLALAGVCVGVGLLPFAVWPVLMEVAVAWRPGLAESPVPPPALMGLVLGNAVLVLCAVAAVRLLRWRMRRNGVVRGPTWDCGYAAPSARMQYSGGSFAGIITEWFSWILCPHRHGEGPSGVFPARARREEHTPETVLERVVVPVAGVLMRVSGAVRRMQHGRVQAYVFYLLVGLAALALLAVMGGGG